MGLTKDTEKKLNEIIDKGTSNPPTPAPYLEARLRKIEKGLNSHDLKNDLVIKAQQAIEKAKVYNKFSKLLTEIAGIVYFDHRNQDIPISGIRRDAQEVAEIMWILGYIKYKYFNLNYSGAINIDLVKGIVASTTRLSRDSKNYIKDQIKKNRAYFLPPIFSMKTFKMEDILNDPRYPERFYSFLKKNPELLELPLSDTEVGKFVQRTVIGELSIILNFPDLIEDLKDRKKYFMSLLKAEHRLLQNNINGMLFQHNIHYEYALLIFKNKNKIKSDPVAKKVYASFKRQALTPKPYTGDKNLKINEKSAKTMIDRIYRNLYSKVKVPDDVEQTINEIVNQNKNITDAIADNTRGESSLTSFADN